MNQTPFFSIMMPTYNQAKFLPSSLNSIICQNDTDWEAVIVDDGSTDDTFEVLKAYEFKDSRVRSFYQENGGTAAALNTALKHCRGKWVCWLSSDDLFEPNKLFTHRQAIAEHPDIAFFHTHFYYLDDSTGEKNLPNPWRAIPGPALQVARFFSGNYISGITVCIERQILKEAGPFRTDLRYGQDFALWLNLSHRERSHYIDKRTATTRWHKGQATNEFPVAGFYDSAWACLEFLNAHPFIELFPILDLDDPEQAELAINETLSICMNPGSFIYQLGYSSALILRMLEWLHDPTEGIGRKKGKQLLKEKWRKQHLEQKPFLIKNMLHTARKHEGPIKFEPEPIEDFVRQTISSPSTEKNKRQNLIHYLDQKI